MLMLWPAIYLLCDLFLVQFLFQLRKSDVTPRLVQWCLEPNLPTPNIVCFRFLFGLGRWSVHESMDRSLRLFGSQYVHVDTILAPS